MFKLRLGSFAGQIPTWNAAEAVPLLIDLRRHALWAWVPSDSAADLVGLDVGQPITSTIEIDISHRGLACISLKPIDEERLVAVAPPTLYMPIASSLNGYRPNQHAVALTVADYCKGQSPDITILRRIASLASQRYEDFKRRGIGWLATINWDDLSGKPAHVERDSELFTALANIVEDRKLVFLLSGEETGLRIFLKQFKTFIAQQCVVTADFDPKHFQRVLSELDQHHRELLDVLQPIYSHTTALFISLAYDAYEHIYAAEGTDKDSLDAYVIPEAVSRINVFVARYLGHLTMGRKGQKCQVLSFLSFLSEMMGAAGRKGKLTILLSFPGLFQWLKESQTEQIAVSVRRSLWDELQAFTNLNYDIDSGEQKSESPLPKLAKQLGIIVELHRLPLTDIAQAFCKRSVLTLPPFSHMEAHRMWEERIGLPIDDADVELLLRYTGGHPWFLDLIIKAAVSAFSGDDNHPLARVHDLIETAANACISLLRKEESPHGTDDLKRQFRDYMRQLERVLSRQTREDTDILDALDRPDQRISPKPMIEEWLESGLVWPSPPPDSQNPFLGFRNYPYITAHRRGTLATILVERLMAVTQ